MNDITFARIHKVFLENYLDERAYNPRQKQYLELKAEVEKILGE